MASTSSESKEWKERRIKCAIHCTEGELGNVIAFSDTAKTKIRKCAEDWRHLSGKEAEIARSILVENDQPPTLGLA